jgi:hypothetical protein
VSFLFSLQLHNIGFPIHRASEIHQDFSSKSQNFLGVHVQKMHYYYHFLSFNMIQLSQVVICPFEALISLRKRIDLISLFSTPV